MKIIDKLHGYNCEKCKYFDGSWSPCDKNHNIHAINKKEIKRMNVDEVNFVEYCGDYESQGVKPK